MPGRPHSGFCRDVHTAAFAGTSTQRHAGTSTQRLLYVAGGGDAHGTLHPRPRRRGCQPHHHALPFFDCGGSFTDIFGVMEVRSNGLNSPYVSRNFDGGGGSRALRIYGGVLHCGRACRPPGTLVDTVVSRNFNNRGASLTEHCDVHPRSMSVYPFPRVPCGQGRWRRSWDSSNPVRCRASTV